MKEGETSPHFGTARQLSLDQDVCRKMHMAMTIQMRRRATVQSDKFGELGLKYEAELGHQEWIENQQRIFVCGQKATELTMCPPQVFRYEPRREFLTEVYVQPHVKTRAQSNPRGSLRVLHEYHSAS